MYVKTKADFISLTQTISEMGFKNNVLSLVFSYLLDGKMWTKLVLFEDVDNYTSWSGCYWVLYESRNGFACGTNGFGEQNLILTYINSGIAPDNDIMDHCADEIAQFGKVTDAKLVSQLKPYGLVDDNGDVLFPIIKKRQDRFHQITEKLVNSISAELKNNCGSLASQYGIDNEKVAMVMLYHECFAHFLRLRRHYPVKLGVFREAVYKGQHHVPVEDKPLARFGVGYILHLLRGDVKLLCKDSPVALCLIEHEDKIGVFKDILDFAAA